MNRPRTPIAMACLGIVIGCGHSASSVQPTTIHPFPINMDVSIISHHGESVELGNFLVEGKLTIFDFYADWCSSCAIFDTLIAEYAIANPEVVAYRKINIVAWDSPVALKFLRDVDQLPYAILVAPNGTRFGPITSLNKDLIFAELNKARQASSLHPTHPK